MIAAIGVDVVFPAAPSLDPLTASAEETHRPIPAHDMLGGSTESVQRQITPNTNRYKSQDNASVRTLSN
jgi:hypothetical protein